MATSLLSRQSNDPFLKNIITDDGKWIFYDDVQRKKQWIDKDESPQPTPNAEIRRKHAVCMVRSLQYFFLKSNRKFNVYLYSLQLQHVHKNILIKSPSSVDKRNVVLFMTTQGNLAINIVTCCYIVIPSLNVVGK